MGRIAHDPDFTWCVLVFFPRSFVLTGRGCSVGELDLFCVVVALQKLAWSALAARYCQRQSI